jgi:hypothetical protein
MTETIVRSGGSPTSDEFLVTADQQTVLGDGSHDRPLHTNPDGVPASTDGVTILGDGTPGDPLRTNPDGVPVATDGTTILGDGTQGDPLRVSPEALASSGVVVFRPGGVAEQNVATTWAGALAILALSQGARVLAFDDSITSPIPIPAGGPYPMTGVAWVGAGSGGAAAISIPEGVTFTGLRTFENILVLFSGTTPPVSDFSGTDSVVLSNGANLNATASGPLFRVSAGVVTFRIGARSEISNAQPVIHVALATSIAVTADGPQSFLGNNTVSGVAGATLILRVEDSAAGTSATGTLSETQPAFLGTIAPRNATAVREYPTTIVTANATLDAISTSAIVRVDPTGGAFNLTLSAASGQRGASVVVKNVSASVNAVHVLAGAGDNIDGAASQDVVGARAHTRFTSDGAHQWMVTG